MKTFVEIGCADFDTLLPLAARGWRGVFVEPIERHCESLRNQARKIGIFEDQIEIAQIAISDHNGGLTMIESIGSDWASGISHVEGEGRASGLLDNPANRQFRGRLIPTTCQTLDRFISDRDLDKIDFMKIDVEGHELAILGSYSWKVKPAFMKVEYKHCGLDPIKRILGREGYLTYVEKEDLYAIY
jgi:FkbM family methyltransferase